ncbi:PilZ domain-containing protein [Pseudomonas sp. Gutcm_11s]|uniref:PilZ domain-containing protein n=1 Tax=Pseudomonas sp. Gutcm_11s TaxID=3026088 RepID=UPI002362A9F4|nr:PilZ domain-containing protein [Pseudomonas sp. Gutcm_11s]MDD0841384.1 PilZ domain-containing protein [Pseudomonas sp. Gutcm_11s]
MHIQRHIERHQLPYYLKVFNRITDKPMGYIGNVSLDGLMLISQYPMLVSARFDMRLKVPGRDGRIHNVDFTATCQWSREDVTPGTFDSGFCLVAPPTEYVEMVDALRSYFSFHPLAASA